MSPNNNNVKQKKKSAAKAARQPGARYPVDPHAMVVFRSPSFVPPRMRRTLRYAQEINLVGTSGAMAINGFALNGAFDPDTTGGGHQPLGFDQYMAMYTRFCVHSCRITAEFALNGAAVPTMAGITGLPTATTYANVTGRIETGTTAYTLIPALMSVPCSLSAVFDLKDYFGVVDLLDEPDIWGTSTSNPATIAGGQVWARDINGTSTVNLSVLVLVEYDMTFLQPATVPQS